jgi:dipeptidyl aminopeptidase/acylaminoacyl peptidase
LRFWLCLVAALAVGSSARAAPALEDFAAASHIDTVVLSPSGDRFALIGADGDKRALYVRRADGTAELGANLGEVRVSGVTWAGEGKLILFTRQVVGGGVTMIARQNMSSGLVIDLPTRTVKAIFKGSNTDNDAGIGWFGARQIDGRWYAFVAGVPLDKMAPRQTSVAVYPDLYRVDLATMTYTRIAKAGEKRTNWALAPDGRIIGHSSFDERGRVQTLYGGADDAVPLMSRPTGQGKLEIDGLGRTADTLLLADRTSGEEVAREVKVTGPNDGEVLYSSVEDDNILRDPVSGLAIGITSRDDPAGVRFIDPNLQKRVLAAAKAFPGARVSLRSYIAGLDRMVVYTESATDSGTYWMVDIAKKSALPIGDARPRIRAADLGAVSMVSYKAADGLALDGILTLPPKSSGKGLPLIVVPHAGPFRPRDDERLDLLAQAFASRGYAVFQPNYRGTLGYGEAFRKQAEGEVGRKLQTDLSDGVAALAAKGVVDPMRVCIVGTGYGAYAALAGVTLQQGLYRCAVGRDGMYDLPAYDYLVRSLSPTDERQTRFKRSAMGPVDGQDLAAISPARHAAQADAPVMIVYAEAAEEGWTTQSKKMEKALKQAGKPVEVFMDPDPARLKPDEHRPDDAAQKALLAAVVAFVEKNNPPN